MPAGDPTYSVWTPEQVMAYVEALLAERDRAADALAQGHQRSLVAGDERLREHVEQEVRNLTTALHAANELERERVALLAVRVDEHQRAVRDIVTGACRSGVELREYIEALLNERDRATSTASIEREKAAQALAINLARSIEEGDANLKSHIAQQVKQIEAALDAARRETAFAAASQKEAIEKAETANDKRFDGVNAFREELSSRWENTMPREVAEAQIAEIKKSMDAIHRRLDIAQGGETVKERSERSEERVQERSQDTATGWKLAVAGFAVTLFVTVVIVLSNLFLSGSP